jgi:hypothetical protein
MLRWSCYPSKKAFKKATHWSHQDLYNHLGELGEELVAHAEANERSLLTLTVVAPKAKDAEESYGLMVGLMEELPRTLTAELGAVFLAAGLEIHRTAPGGRNRASRTLGKAEAAAAAEREVGVTLLEDAEQDQKREDALAAEHSLLGNGHLHLTVLLPRRNRLRIRALDCFWRLRNELDLTIAEVGGPVRPEPPAERVARVGRKRLEGARNVLRYPFKEYRINAEEQKGTRLKELGIGNGSCFWCWADPTLPEVTKHLERGALKLLGEWVGELELELLDNSIGGLALEPEDDAGFVLEKAIDYFLATTGHRLRRVAVNRRQNLWTLELLRPALLHLRGGLLEPVAEGYRALLGALEVFYAKHRTVRRMLQRRSGLRELVELGGPNLDPKGLVGEPGSHRVLADGCALFWSEKELLLRSHGEFMAWCAAHPHQWTKNRLGLGWFELQLRLREDGGLPQLERFLHHPELTEGANRLRLGRFLRWLGLVVRRKDRDRLGLLLWGRSGTGKSTFSRRLLECLYGPMEEGGWTIWNSQSGFGTAAMVGAQALVLDETAAESLNQGRLKGLMSVMPTLTDLKGKEAVTQEGQRLLLLLTSNDPPKTLFGNEWMALRKRFGLRLELTQPLDTKGNRPDWVQPELLWGSSGSGDFGELPLAIVLGLLLTTPELEQRWERELRSQPEALRALLESPPLELFGAGETSLLEAYTPEQIQEMAERLERKGQHYLFPDGSAWTPVQTEGGKTQRLLLPPVSRSKWLEGVSFGKKEEAQEEQITGTEPDFVPLVDLGGNSESPRPRPQVWDFRA